MIAGLAPLARRWLPLVLLCVVVAVGVSVIRSTQQSDVYESTTKLLFKQQDFSQALVGLSTQPVGTDPSRQAATNIALVSASTVIGRTAEQLGTSRTAVRDDVVAAAEGQSDVVSVTASGPSPEAAKTLADTYASEFVAFRRDADRATLEEAERVLEQQIAALGDGSGSRRRTLERNVEQLRVLSSLQNGGVQVVQPGGIATSPSSPQPLRSGLIAAVLGLLVGLGLAFASQRLDQRLRTVDDVAAILESPTLAVVPALRHPNLLNRTNDVELEPFRLLHANLKYFPASADVKVVALTSSVSGEGKSTLAANLAIAGAEAGDRILLIEADLRAPRLAGYLGVSARRGLSEYLSGLVDLDDVRVQVTQDDGRGFDFLPCGNVPPNPTVLLASGQMSQLLDVSRAEYDLVIIDGPPALIVSDATVLLAAADGVIVTTRLEMTRRRALRDLHAKLVNQGVDLIGFIANGVKQQEGTYGYGYGYGRQEPRPRTDQPSEPAPVGADPVRS